MRTEPWDWPPTRPKATRPKPPRIQYVDHHEQNWQRAWDQASAEHPVAHAIFLTGIWTWKVIIFLVLFGLITGSIWLMQAIGNAVIGIAAATLRGPPRVNAVGGLFCLLKP
jgi:hypothetical protein